MRHVDVAGRRIAYEQTGDGPDLVLLHGAMTDLRSWGDVVDLLGTTFRVTAFDAPGCGGSDDPADTWRMDDANLGVAGAVRFAPSGLRTTLPPTETCWSALPVVTSRCEIPEFEQWHVPRREVEQLPGCVTA